MLRTAESWRRRRKVYSRRRKGVPVVVKKMLTEAVYGALLALFTFPISLFIAEMGVWVSILWMQPMDMILTNFYVVLVAIQAMFLLIPAYHKQPVRLIVAALVAYLLWLMLVGVAGFHPVLTAFGKLPY